MPGQVFSPDDVVLQLFACFQGDEAHVNAYSRNRADGLFCSLRCQVPSREAANLAVRLGARYGGTKLTLDVLEARLEKKLVIPKIWSLFLT